MEVEPVRELTDGEVKQMLSEYRAIADMDDAECTPWQRQLRVNKMMLEQGVREMIMGLVNPVVKSQQAVEVELRAGF